MVRSIVGGAGQKRMATRARMSEDSVFRSMDSIGSSQGLGDRVSRFGRAGWNNARDRVGGDNLSLVKAIGGDALRGAVVSGAAGGTLEAAQGGSFWAGAKEGAFNGAAGWGAYRYAGRAYSATGKGVGNTLSGAANNWGVMSKDAQTSLRSMAGMSSGQIRNMANVSKQVTAIQRNLGNVRNSPSKK